uniref:Uncharacterized protein n=1 Tax=Timema tahoe TaxID=61484 RepID=A0A7R9NU05_9NEOP|nr:unnamed protein product [Timema tahoe]
MNLHHISSAFETREKKNLLTRTVSWIRDWLTLEEEMLRQQTVVVGDVDDILQVLDKQKVRARHMLLCEWPGIWCVRSESSIVPLITRGKGRG